MAPLIMVLSILFGGFYINTDSIPVWLRWLDLCSHIRWSYTAFAINEFTDAEFKGCPEGEIGCFSNGEQVLELLSMQSFSLWDPIRNMLIMFVFYHLVAYLLLRFKGAKFMEVSRPSSNKNDSGRT